MKEPFPHAMMPLASHDERAREQITASFKIHMEDSVYPANGDVFERRTRPAFARQNKRDPQTRQDVRKAMSSEPFYQMWSAIARTLQEQLWDNVGECVERQLPELIERARVGNRKVGSLMLNPGMEIPRYNAAIDIHCMPGGYHTEYGSDDVYQGALYDRGAFMYGRGLRGPMHDGYAQEIKLYLEKACPPGFKPKKILDMGCAIGSSTGAIARMFPDAEIHGIDIGAGMLRYAHARAEAMKTPIHFSQQNAEGTDFEDESFDLVFSCILMHETSSRALPNYIRETKRLLKPGGIALHLDFPHNEGKTPFAQAFGDWSTHYNAEPFIGTLGDTDVTEVALSAGFTSNTAAVVPMAQYIPGNYMHMLDLRKPA